MVLPKPSNKKNNFKPNIVAITFFLLILGVISSIGIKLYSTTILMPMGSKISNLETQYNELTDRTFTTNNEKAYYTSSELVRVKAMNDLGMQNNNNVVYLESNKLAFIQ